MAKVRRVTIRQYRSALDYVCARTGTGVPTGGAEKALSFLHDQGERLWAFVDRYLVERLHGIYTDTSMANEQEKKDRLVKEEYPQTGGGPQDTQKNDHSATGINLRGGAISWDEEASVLEGSAKLWSIPELLHVLSSFLDDKGEDGCHDRKKEVSDLGNFLYLEGQVKVRI